MKSKISYEYVKKCFEEKDCVLLENKYVNAVTRMKFICKKNRACHKNRWFTNCAVASKADCAVLLLIIQASKAYCPFNCPVKCFLV